MQSSKLIVAVLVLQGLVLMGQWTGQGPLTPAHAQIPDAGAQRAHMLEELKNVNGKLDRLLQVLESGTVQVRPVSSDQKKK